MSIRLFLIFLRDTFFQASEPRATSTHVEVGREGETKDWHRQWRWRRDEFEGQGDKYVVVLLIVQLFLLVLFVILEGSFL